MKNGIIFLVAFVSVLILANISTPLITISYSILSGSFMIAMAITDRK